MHTYKTIKLRAAVNVQKLLFSKKKTNNLLLIYMCLMFLTTTALIHRKFSSLFPANKKVSAEGEMVRFILNSNKLVL